MFGLFENNLFETHGRYKNIQSRQSCVTLISRQHTPKSGTENLCVEFLLVLADLRSVTLRSDVGWVHVHHRTLPVVLSFEWITFTARCMGRKNKTVWDSKTVISRGFFHLVRLTSLLENVRLYLLGLCGGDDMGINLGSIKERKEEVEDEEVFLLVGLPTGWIERTKTTYLFIDFGSSLKKDRQIWRLMLFFFFLIGRYTHHPSVQADFLPNGVTGTHLALVMAVRFFNGRCQLTATRSILSDVN